MFSATPRGNLSRNVLPSLKTKVPKAVISKFPCSLKKSLTVSLFQLELSCSAHLQSFLTTSWSCCLLWASSPCVSLDTGWSIHKKAAFPQLLFILLSPYLCLFWLSVTLCSNTLQAHLAIFHFAIWSRLSPSSGLGCPIWCRVSAV